MHDTDMKREYKPATGVAGFLFTGGKKNEPEYRTNSFHWHHFFLTVFIIRSMKRILFIIAALMLLSWIVGFFIWNAGVYIHVFFMVSAILCMRAIILTSGSTVEKAKTA